MGVPVGSRGGVGRRRGGGIAADPVFELPGNRLAAGRAESDGCIRPCHRGPAAALRCHRRSAWHCRRAWVFRLASKPGSNLAEALLARPAPGRDAQLGLRKPGRSRDGRKPERLRKRRGSVQRARSGRRRGGRSLRLAGAPVTPKSPADWRGAQRKHRPGSAAPHAGTGGLRGTRPRHSGPGARVLSERVAGPAHRPSRARARHGWAAVSENHAVHLRCRDRQSAGTAERPTEPVLYGRILPRGVAKTHANGSPFLPVEVIGRLHQRGAWAIPALHRQEPAGGVPGSYGHSG